MQYEGCIVQVGSYGVCGGLTKREIKKSPMYLCFVLRTKIFDKNQLVLNEEKLQF